MSVRNLAYNRGWLEMHRVGVPVIAIGNLTVGGTGKSPTVAMLARRLRKRGLRVAIISRGYGSGDGTQNDEAIELEKALPDVPHIQNVDRVAAARIAIEELESQVILMDDGFQHRRLHRDLDIVLLDATQPFGFGHLLPRGLLRESIRSLRRAGVVLVTRTDQIEPRTLDKLRKTVQRINANCLWATAVHQPVRLRNAADEMVSLEQIRQRDCYVFCAIGNPSAFRTTVTDAGGKIVGFQAFPDHHRFTSEDIVALEAAIQKAIGESAASDLLVLCTGKDLAKVNVTHLAGCPVYALEIEMVLTAGSEALDERLAVIIQ